MFSDLNLPARSHLPATASLRQIALNSLCAVKKAVGIALVTLFASGLDFVLAQDLSKGMPILPPPDAETNLIEPSWETQKNARTLLLTLPAPRGLIVDRNGRPFAQTRMAQNLAIAFPTPLDFSDERALSFIRQQFAVARGLIPGRALELDETLVLRIYKQRGILPYFIADDLRPEEVAALKDRLPPGLRLVPSYVRFYPEGATAGHVIGYCGKSGGIPDAPVQNNDSIWPDFEGREGIEQTFNTQLTGKPGQLNIVIDRTGTKVAERVSIAPQPGGNVVLSLDIELQRTCEEVLRKRTKRGAIVVLQPSTGDILALASWPTFNPNDFTPSISPSTFQALQDDPNVPLLPRAYRSAYPPGSTFKIFVGIAALENGVVDTETTFDCPASISLGRITFRNWKSSGSGFLNFRAALEQSCNTWFYRVGMNLGAEPIIDWSFRLGLGQRTGIPLRAESDGRIPTDEYFQRTHGRPILKGDVCSISIGQSDVLISPLQMAQAMVPLANGGTLLKARLVKQVQRIDNEIEVAYQVRARNYIGMRPEYYEEVRQAMNEVVHGGSGTGGRAAPKGIRVAGKTGTAQWGPKTNERTAAWFCGYAPAQAPELAFAALFEGDASDDAHGGSHAAPMIGDVLKWYFKDRPKSDDDEAAPEPNEEGEVVLRAEAADPSEGETEAELQDRSN